MSSDDFYNDLFEQAGAEPIKRRRRPTAKEQLNAADHEFSRVESIYREHPPGELSHDLEEELDSDLEQAHRDRMEAFRRIQRGSAISNGRRDPANALNAERRRISDELDRLLRDLKYDRVPERGDIANATRDLRRVLQLGERRADITIGKISRKAVTASLARIRPTSSSTT